MQQTSRIGGDKDFNVFLETSLFLAQRVWVFHPVLALFLYMVAVGVCIAILLAVANSRGRSGLWSLFGLWLVPGVIVGLLVLIALPSNQPPEGAA